MNKFIRINGLLILVVGVSLGVNAARFTAFGPEGDFSSFFLVGHAPQCGDSQAITQFKLAREFVDGQARGNLRYEFSCTDVEVLPPHVEKTTNWNDDGQGNIVYLDRHSVACEPGEILNGFGLARRFEDKTAPAGQIRYEYRCVNVGAHKATFHETEFNDEGAGSSIYLDRHNVSCPDGTALNSFRLVRNQELAQYKYVYTCAELPKKALSVFDQIRAGGKPLRKVVTNENRTNCATAEDNIQAALDANVKNAVNRGGIPASNEKNAEESHEFEDVEGPKAPPNSAESSYVKAQSDEEGPKLAYLKKAELIQAKIGKRHGRITEAELETLLLGLPEAELGLLFKKALGHITQDEYNTGLAEIQAARVVVAPATQVEPSPVNVASSTFNLPKGDLRAALAILRAAQDGDGEDGGSYSSDDE